MTDITTKLRSGEYGWIHDLSEPAADEIDRLSAELAEVSQWLGNLLAIIHRDGGHYQAEHGTEKACTDAETAVHVLRGSLDGYIEANRYMKGELDDALEDARKYAAAQDEIARLRLREPSQAEMNGLQTKDAEIARLREALGRLLCATEGFAVDIVAKQKARAALGDAP